MKYQVAFKPRAAKDLQALPAETARRVIQKIQAMTDDLAGDVKKLTNFAPEYRLRVGDYRVLFQVAGPEVVIYRVVHRREAYR